MQSALAAAALPVASARVAPSVTDWGARCDGRSDDTNAFQRAMNERVPVLRVPAGRCLLSPGIKFGVDGQQILGAGLGRTILVLTRSLNNDDFIAAAGWDGCGLSDLTLDGGNFSQGEANTALLAFAGVSGPRLMNVGFVGFDRFALGMNFVSDFEVRNCRFQRSSAAATQNESILVSSHSGATVRGLVKQCTSLNSGFEFDGADISVENCTISDWKFGGGITLDATDHSKRARIVNNLIHGGFGRDSNATDISGIENWAPDSFISGNRVYGCGGAGIDQGGKNSTLENNECFDNNRNGGQYPGIVARCPSAQFNGSGTTFVRNRCYNTANGHQAYGYSEESALLSDIVLDGNDFEGNEIAPTLIRSPSTRLKG